MDPKGKGVKAKLDDRDCTKRQSFCTAKETAHKTERRPPERGTVFANNGSDWSTARPSAGKDETLPCETTWVDPEDSVLREASQAGKGKNHMMSLSRGTGNRTQQMNRQEKRKILLGTEDSVSGY